MPGLGVNVALIEDGRLLLTQREDFEVWCLPGGGLEENETAVEGAVREMREETGLEVRITHLVGIYSEINSDLGGACHMLVFLAERTGGELAPDPNEVINIDMFGPDEIPPHLLWAHRQRIADVFEHALHGKTDADVWLQDIGWTFGDAPRDEVYARRDREGGTRLGFYNKHLNRPGPRGEIRQLDFEDRSPE